MALCHLFIIDTLSLDVFNKTTCILWQVASHRELHHPYVVVWLKFTIKAKTCKNNNVKLYTKNDPREQNILIHIKQQNERNVTLIAACLLGS